MNRTGKLAVIGDKDSILAFKAIGADVFSPNGSFEANDLVRQLARDNYAVIFITEDIAVLIADTLARFKTRPYPSIIPIPAACGATGYGMAGLKKDVEKAIGADILFNKEGKN